MALDLDSISARAKTINSWMIGHDFRSVQIRNFTRDEVPALIDEIRRLRTQVAVRRKGAVPEEIGTQSIDSLHLGKRLGSSLKARGIHEVASLVTLRPEQVLGPGVGEATLKKLRAVLSRHGLSLRDDPMPRSR